MKAEPLAIIGQGDNRREIGEDDTSAPRVPSPLLLALSSLWLFFGVLAWLYDLAKRHH